MTKPRIVFSHMAKTGGTALLYHFRQSLGPEAVLMHGPHTRVMSFFADELQTEELSIEQRQAASIVQGHGVTEQTLGLLGDPGFKLMVVLRAPVGLTRSRFNHRVKGLQRRGISLDGAGFLKTYERNGLAGALVRLFPTFVDDGGASGLEQALSVLRKFEYVYTTENLNAQARPMMRLHGLPEEIERKRVAGTSKLELDVSDRAILAENEVDQALFEATNHVVGGDGSTHNALGFDAAARADAYARVSAAQPNGEQLRTICYEKTANALCQELKGEAALLKIEVAPDTVRILHLDRFSKILRSRFENISGQYNEAQASASAQHAAKWMRRHG